nr:MAG TPA: hypothetical protein [Caudoviricetes sp.]
MSIYIFHLSSLTSKLNKSVPCKRYTIFQFMSSAF